MDTKTNPWKDTLIDELVCLHIYNATHEDNPRKALHDAINWNVQVALDPQVSSDATSLIERGIAEEREAILDICSKFRSPDIIFIEQMIKNRIKRDRRFTSSNDENASPEKVSPEDDLCSTLGEIIPL